MPCVYGEGPSTDSVAREVTGFGNEQLPRAGRPTIPLFRTGLHAFRDGRGGLRHHGLCGISRRARDGRAGRRAPARVHHPAAAPAHPRHPRRPGDRAARLHPQRPRRIPAALRHRPGRTAAPAALSGRLHRRIRVGPRAHDAARHRPADRAARGRGGGNDRAPPRERLRTAARPRRPHQGQAADGRTAQRVRHARGLPDRGARTPPQRQRGCGRRHVDAGRGPDRRRFGADGERCGCCGASGACATRPMPPCGSRANASSTR